MGYEYNKSNNKEYQKNRYEEYMSLVGSIILTLDSDGIVTYINEKGCEILGYPESDIIGSPWVGNFIPSASRDEIESIRKVVMSLKPGERNYREGQIITSEGQHRWIRWSNSVLFNEKNKMIGTLSSGEDITTIKENEKRLLDSETRLKDSEAMSHTGHWVRDLKSKNYIFSDELYRIFGLNRKIKLIYADHLHEKFHPDDADKIIEYTEKCLSEGKDYTFDGRLLLPGNKLKYIKASVKIIKDENGNPVSAKGVMSDVTAEKLFEEELLKKTKTLENAESIAHIGHWERDFKNDSMYWSDEIYRIIGYNPASFEVYPNKDREFIHPDDWDELQKVYKLTMTEGTPFEIDVRAYMYKGDEIILKIKGGITRKESEGLIISGTVEDITELKRHYEEIEYMNYHDPLTGLYNRRYFDEQFNLIDTQEYYPISIIIADVNGLKMINDTQGHSAGDEILKRTADILDRSRDESDILARIWGDDFAILLPRTIKSQAELVVNEIHNLLVKETGDMNLSVSMGLSVKFDSAHRKEDIIKEAEDNMYTNKLYEKSSKQGDMLRLIMDALYERSSREELHSERVSKYCGDLGKVLKLPKHKINELTALGLLHDIGKISVRDSVLNKPGSLDEEEWQEIKRHPETGYRILSKAPGMQDASKYILAHHERWDGKGYPNEIGTYDIPLQARIIAIADAFDAMRSKRPYRDPLPLDIAVSEIKKGAGTQFDPELAKVFVIEVLKKEW